MSSTNLTDNPLTARLRDKLNAESMKLWLEPFYDTAAKVVKDAEIIALGSRYAIELELAESDVIECLFALQQHSLEKFAEREAFKTTGKATIRFRYSGEMTAEEKQATSALQKVQISLPQNNGKDLKNLISEITGIGANRLKLICSGKVIDDDKMLEAQRLKNGSQVMVLFIGTSKETFQETENQFKQLEEIKSSADYLASNDRGEVYTLQVADQSGRPLDLPEEERKRLAVALALHNRGRGALKLNDFSKALVFLLEADSAYSQCQSALLEMVDNYGILNLDIAWCYLSLQSIAELPEAEQRLQKCDGALRRSYGEDLERVVALKGSAGWEAALFVRLHLLQAIAAYHLGQIEKSRFLITKAEGEANRLKVSDEKLAELINMGYKENESRMALRATFGDTVAAVDWIIRRREEKEQIKNQEQENSERRKLQKQLGKCDNGEHVNTRTFLQLKEMGFSPVLSGAALRRANNDMNVAIQLLSDDSFIREIREKILLPPPTQPIASTSTNPGTSTSETTSSQTPPQAQAQTQTGEPLSLPAVSSELLLQMADQLFNQGLLDGIKPLAEEDIQKSEKAYESLSKDTCSEAEYIDLTLSAETQYIEQYKTLLASIR